MNLDELNPEQRAAVLAPDGPILILAGAGSGKTRVLTYRIAHIMAERKASPFEMLAVTFTNKAALEMRERVATLVGDDAAQPWVSTFHSACARILRQEGHALGYDRNFSILDEGDSLATIRRVLDDAALADSPPLELARARIEQAKNEAISPEQMLTSAQPGREASIARIYRLYQERMREMNAMDFSDLQLQTWILFQRFPEVLEKWQRRATHLLVDEYQDTNRVQYLIVKTLAARSGNLCVVGDEDQSIYRWRGADIRNILDFERDYPAAQIFKLEQNYRSTKTILAAAGGVIRNNTERKIKNLWTENGAGEPVTYYTGVTERDEADFIALEIARLTGSGGFRAADVVVFYRVNAQSRAIEEALVRRRIPYYVVGGVRFYEQRDIKDLLAYLRVIANPADAVSLERMIGTPPRGIGAKSFEAITELAARQHITAFEAMGRLETYSKVALRIAKQAGMLYSWMHDLSARAARDERARNRRGSRRAQRLRALPRHARRRLDAQAESGRDAHGGQRLRRREVRRRPARVSRTRRAGQRQRADRFARRSRRADDAAYVEGPRISDRLHRRDGGRTVPAQPLRRYRRGSRGGAPALLRRHDARAPVALSHQHAVARNLRRAPGVAAIATSCARSIPR